MYLGTRRRLLCTFNDFPDPGSLPGMLGALADPDAVVVTLRKPDGTSVDNSPVRDSTGLYHFDFVPDQVGIYYADWVGTGLVAAADVDKFEVIARA